MFTLPHFLLGRTRRVLLLLAITTGYCLPLLSVASVSLTVGFSSGVCCSSLAEVVVEPDFNFSLDASGDITVSNPNGITLNVVGNKLDFSSGDSTSSITFSNNNFNVTVLSTDTVLVSDFDTTGFSVDAGDGIINFVGDANALASFGGSGSGSIDLGGFEIITTPGIIGVPLIDSPVVVNPDFGPIAFVLPTVADQSPALITLADATQSVASTSNAGGLVLSSISTVLNGAHSRPLSRLVSKGEKAGWVAGDWGVDHHDSRNGDLGLAEVGVGYHFGPVQMNLALGKTWSDQDTLLGGSIDADGKFVMVEGIIPVTQVAGLYATVTGYGHWGEVEVERGYLNAGSPDFSAASPDSRTWGLRARLDWQNVVSWQSADFTPYVDLSFSDSHLDSFTETGGAFPASFDSRDEEVTELRLGINGELPLFNNRARLLGNLEAAHRFDGEGSRTSGELIGLFSFNLPGSDYDQEWFKAGIGIEGDLGKGKVSFMLNGTTEGEMPSAWAAFAYQVKF